MLRVNPLLTFPAHHPVSSASISTSVVLPTPPYLNLFVAPRPDSSRSTLTPRLSPLRDYSGVPAAVRRLEMCSPREFDGAGRGGSCVFDLPWMPQKSTDCVDMAKRPLSSGQAMLMIGDLCTLVKVFPKPGPARVTHPSRCREEGMLAEPQERRREPRRMRGASGPALLDGHEDLGPGCPHSVPSAWKCSPLDNGRIQ